MDSGAASAPPTRECARAASNRRLIRHHIYEHKYYAWLWHRQVKRFSSAAAAADRRRGRQHAVGLPAPRARPPVGREHAAALDGQERHDRFAHAQTGAEDVVHHPVAITQLEDRDVGLPTGDQTARRCPAPMALAGFAVHMVTTCGSVKPSPRKRVIISFMLCTVLSRPGTVRSVLMQCGSRP